MSQANTVADFLPLDVDGLPGKLAASVKAVPQLARLMALLSTKLTAVQWKAFLHTLAGKVAGLRDEPLTPILAGAWKDIRKVAEAIEITRRSPGRVETVAVADHTIEHEERPTLEVYLDGSRVEEIPCSLSLEIELRGLLLEIEGGTLRKMTTGEVQLKGTFKLADVVLAEKQLQPIAIPGEIPLTG